jgi:hypothetical protein
MAQVKLVDLIDQVAMQLLEAEDRAKKRGDRVMDFAECELEVAISVESGGKGGVRVWVLELGGGRTKTDTNTIKIRFTPRPERPIAVPAELEGEGPKLGPQKSSRDAR